MLILQRPLILFLFSVLTAILSAACGDDSSMPDGDLDGETANGESDIPDSDADSPGEESPDGDLDAPEGEEGEADTLRVFYTEDGFIRDRDGRAIILRAIAFPSKDLDYWSEQPPDQDETDLAFIAESGFNAIRLGINWSRIEPERDQYDESYLDLVARHARLAADQGLYIFIDMHQDLYGVGFGLEGAPYWTCDEAYYESFEPIEPWFFNYFSEEVKACFDGFWESEELQRHQRNAAAALASRLTDNAYILGFDTFNEPLPGNMSWDDFGRDALWPFQERFFEALNAALPGRMVFFEPAVTFSATLSTTMTGPQGGFPAVFAPHYYNQSVENDWLWDGDPTSDRAAIDAIAAEAERMNVPWVLGEMGGDRRTTNLDDYLMSLYAMIDEKMANSAIWIFSKGTKGFGLYDSEKQDWTEHASAYLRPAPSAVAGTPQHFAWNYDSLTFTLTWDEKPGIGDTEILIPKWMREAGLTLTVDGSPAIPEYSEHHRLIVPAGDAAVTRSLEIIVKEEDGG